MFIRRKVCLGENCRKIYFRSEMLFKCAGCVWVYEGCKVENKHIFFREIYTWRDSITFQDHQARNSLSTVKNNDQKSCFMSRLLPHFSACIILYLQSFITRVSYFSSSSHVVDVYQPTKHETHFASVLHKFLPFVCNRCLFFPSAHECYQLIVTINL